MGDERLPKLLSSQDHLHLKRVWYKERGFVYTFNTTLQNINNIINIITSKFSKFKEKMQGGERFRG